MFEISYTKHPNLFCTLLVGRATTMITHKEKASRGVQVGAHPNTELAHTHVCTQIDYTPLCTVIYKYLN